MKNQRAKPNNQTVRPSKRAASMSQGKPNGMKTLAAGGFTRWLKEMKDAMRGKRASNVPCGECTACCTSSQFVHIGPDEKDSLAHIPKKLLFPAPLLPKGHVVLGYDQKGRCPMLVKGRCSIYEHRPKTCRTYDCRIFQAAGLTVEKDKPLIARQAKRWKFKYPSKKDKDQRKAIQTAAAFLLKHKDKLPVEFNPSNATQYAILAVQLHESFLFRNKKSGEQRLFSMLDRLGRPINYSE
jgi:Fe-S-cluster containining protein